MAGTATKTDADEPKAVHGRKGDDALAYVLTMLAKSATFHEESTAKAVAAAIVSIGSAEDYVEAQAEAKTKADAKAKAEALRAADEAAA
jgi:hypothetical protein